MDKGTRLVYASGSVTVTNDYKQESNNTSSLSCYEERKECFFILLHEIGPNHVDRIDSPSIYIIKKWDDFQIVAELEYRFSCSKSTITIDKLQKRVFGIEEPINQNSIYCKDVINKVKKWTIDDSPYIKKIKQK